MPLQPVPGSRVWRLLRHRWCDERDVARALPDDALARLEAAIHASEHQHTGELRISVEAGLPLSYLWRRASARARAIALFGKLNVWDTEHNNGVVIYLLLAERSIEIVADRGLARKVPAAEWQAMVALLAPACRAGDFEGGLQHCVSLVGDLLQQHFPAAEGGAPRNELSNSVDLR